MKLGEIKMQALRMMFVTATADHEGEDLTILAGDEECKDYIAGMPGAINRCFANMESRDLLPIKRAALSTYSGEVYGGSVRYTLSSILPDLFKVERVAWESEEGGYIPSIGYAREGDVLMLGEIPGGERYIILYRPRIKRVTSLTDDETEIDIPDHIAALIPYFIKGELFRQDEPDEAQEARNLYEAGLAEIAYESEGVQGKVKTVYGMAGD